MTIYERERNGRPINPALALYRFWHATLTGLVPESRNADNRLIGNVNLGRDYGAGIAFAPEGPPDQPTIVGPGIHLNHKGEFKMFPHHGQQQRHRTARNTFLGWSYWRGYNWFVDTSNEVRGWEWAYGGAVKNWREPRHYVYEGVLGMRRSYWDNRPWLKLNWSDDLGWHIRFSRNADTMRPQYASPECTKEQFDRFEALRQKRYRLLERAEKIASGEWTVDNKRIITAEEREERRAEAIKVIMANLAVSQPARTVPLRRDREEEGLWPLQHGCP